MPKFDFSKFDISKWIPILPNTFEADILCFLQRMGFKSFRAILFFLFGGIIVGEVGTFLIRETRIFFGYLELL